MKILIIDNYDSFTYNLYQYVGELLVAHLKKQNFEVVVKRNNAVTLAEIARFAPERIIISPGPGDPSNQAYFGICAEVIKEFGPKVPLLGVCLGMQGIAHCFGGKVVRAPKPMHGKVSTVVHDNAGVYARRPQHLEIMRYHSLMVEAASLPSCLTITSITDDGLGEPMAAADFKARAEAGREIMGLRHHEFPIEGVQFHPESFATEGGRELLKNFIFRD